MDDNHPCGRLGVEQPGMDDWPVWAGKWRPLDVRHGEDHSDAVRELYQLRCLPSCDSGDVRPTVCRENPIWVDEWRTFIRELGDVALVQVAKDLRGQPEDEGRYEEVLWEIARRSWESYVGFNRWNQPWQKWPKSR